MNTSLLERPITVPMPMDGLTRREFLTGLVAAGLLSACGGRSGDEGPKSGSDTRRVTHAFGEVDIPVGPKRVLALNVTAADPVLTLGVPVIAVPSSLPAVLEPLADGVERLSEEVNVEQVAALRPDLILSAEFEGELFEGIPIANLQAIAPTVAYAFESDYKWRDYYRFFADVVGRSPEAQEVLQRLEDRSAALARRLPDAGSTGVAVVRVYEDGFVENYRRDTSFASSVLDPLGFPVPETLKGVEEISLENLSALDTGALYIFTRDTEAAPEVERLQAQPLYQQLNVVRAGKAFVVGPHWFGFGARAAGRVLDDVERTLLA